MKIHVLSPDQLACLASPARNEVYTAFRGRDAQSVREASEGLGRSSEAVQYHVRALIHAGLLQVAGSRPTKRKPETLYKAAHRRLQLPDPREDPESATLTRKAVAAGLRQAARGYLRAAEASEGEDGNQIESHVLKGVFRLEPDAVRRVLEAVESAFELAKELESPSGDRIHWTSILFSDIATSGHGGSPT